MVVVEVVGKGVDGNLKKQDNMQKRLQEAASKASKHHKHTHNTLPHTRNLWSARQGRAKLPPVPSEFSFRLPEESWWLPTQPPMDG